MSQELSVQKTEIVWKSMKYLAWRNIMEYQSILLHVVAFCVTRCTRISKRDWTAADFGSSFSCITCDRFPMVHQAARGGMWLKRRERESGNNHEQSFNKQGGRAALTVFSMYFPISQRNAWEYGWIWDSSCFYRLLQPPQPPADFFAGRVVCPMATSISLARTFCHSCGKGHDGGTAATNHSNVRGFLSSQRS